MRFENTSTNIEKELSKYEDITCNHGAIKFIGEVAKDSFTQTSRLKNAINFASQCSLRSRGK